jgi:hypothetical protein
MSDILTVLYLLIEGPFGQGCGVGVRSNFGTAGVGVGKNVPTPTSI